MEGLVYLVIGVGLLAGLYWTLTQITRRQRRVDESLKRLEELAAEVSMEAGAVLEEADERIALLRELLEAVELKAAGQERDAAAPEESAVKPTPEPAAEAAKPEKPVSSLERYQGLRASVWRLADQGLTAPQIAQQLGVPRGEVELMLNLKRRRMNA